MEGDFSRGHRPDGKRGRNYRRVLARQGAPLLDSDLHALADLGDRLDRQGLQHLAGPAGGTGLGFFVTAGRLLALFDPAEGVQPQVAGGASAVRDFSRRHLDRLPGLRIEGAAGTVTIAFRTPLAAPAACRLWLRADHATTITVDGVALALPAGTAFAPFAASLSGGQVAIRPGAEPCWLALIETHEPSGAEARFHWAAGGFQIGGLLTQARDARWPDLSGPAGTALATASAGAAGTRWLAYLELSERVVTAVEDPGLREQALGDLRETTSRAEVVAQVKLARVPDGTTPAAARTAFAQVLLPSGRVTFGTSAGSAAADPCDLPVPGGYSGPENRLYRLAVHDVTGGLTRFKWSRDNAADLWPCTLLPEAPPGAPATHVRVAAQAALRAGDLVELTSDAIERGDAAPGEVTAAGFRRPRRAQGRLFRLAGGEVAGGAGREFRLLDPVLETPVAGVDPAPFGTDGLKLRRWSGLLDRTGSGAVTLTLEHGLEAHVTGTFEAGDWWQTEARVLAPQANGPVVSEPHGPERQFAPLALLRRGAAGVPLEVLGWLSPAIRRLDAQEADATSYDGARVGTPADTVQEALDELFLRLSDGCGEIAVPVGAPVQSVIDTIPNGGNARICLNAGRRDLTAAIVVADKGDLVLGGIGPGTVLRSPLRLVLRFLRCRSVDLRDFVIESQGGGQGPILEFEDCGEVRIDSVRITGAGPVEQGSAAVRQHSAAARPTRHFGMRRCRLSLGQGDSGLSAADPGHAEVCDNEIEIRRDAFDFLGTLAAPGETAAAVGSLLIDRVAFLPDTTATSAAIAAAGGPPVGVAPMGGARANILMHRRFWGREALSFTTHVTTTSVWEGLARANQPGSGAQTEPEGMQAFLSDLRRGLARRVFGVGGDWLSFATFLTAAFARFRNGVAGTNTLQHGRTGIAVGMSRGPSQLGWAGDPVAGLFAAASGQSARIHGNRVEGFAQGIRVGASAGPQRNRHLFAQSVEVADNRIALRLPWQARQRGGIWVGNALSVAVTGNRIIDPAYVPRAGTGAAAIEALDVDGIRLWGWFGPFVQVTGNLVHGATVGLRWQPMGRSEPMGARRDVFVRAVRDNAYSGDWQAQLPASIP